MRKIGVTASEMLELRKQGLSNQDIANVLDISAVTVRRYIGKQGKHMEHLAAFEDKPKETEEFVPVKPTYNPIPVTERYAIKDYEIDLSSEEKLVTIRGEGEVYIAFEDIPDLVQFLAWARMNRMKDDLGENV